MRTSLLEFNNQVEQIKTHLNVLEKYNELIKNQSNDTVDFIKAHSTDEKLFAYRSNIISLYGAFEQFVESLIKEYIQLVRVYYSSFEEWGEKVTKNYFDVWKKLHGKLSYPKFNSITQNSMIENLYDVIRNNKGNLMPECYLQNGGNYKSTIISNMFSEIGFININDVVIKYEPLKTYLFKQYPNAQHIETSQKLDLYFQQLDDLVERRNEIAHGSQSSPITNNDDFREILSFVSFYAASLNSFLMDRVYEKQWEFNKTKAVKIKKVFHSGSVALLNVEEMKVNGIDSFVVGDSLLVNYKESDCSRFFMSKIEEIRVDLKNGGTDKVVGLANVNEEIENISIGVSKKVKSGQKLKVIKSQ